MNGDGIRLLVAGDVTELIPVPDGSFDIDHSTTVESLQTEIETRPQPDVVLTGPGGVGDGWESVIETVRAADPLLPVLMIDSDVCGERASAVTAHGRVEYLAGPVIDRDDLHSRIETAATRYRTVGTYRDRYHQHQAFLEELPYSIYIKDREARFLAVSDHLENTIGFDPTGKTDREIWGDDEGDSGERSYRDDIEVIRTEESKLDMIEEIDPAQGDRLTLLTSKVPWYDHQGEVAGVLGISLNVTEYKQEEKELREATERLERFTAFVSNDLRNPINVAQGFLEHALATGETTSLDRVGETLEHLENLVDELLTITRDEELEPRLVPFAPLVDRSWRSSPTAYLTLELAVPDDAYILAVPGQLRHLLDNLYRNAAEHAGPAVTVKVGLTRTGFYVEDDGDGIPPEKRDRLFDYDDPEAETGIGLAMVNEIARVHGWRATVTESATGGARFEFHDCVIHRGLPDQCRAGSTRTLQSVATIGDAKPAGLIEEDGEAIALRAGGENLYGEIDEHVFYHSPVEGNARLTVRIAELSGPHEYSKAGVMVRSSPQAGTPLLFVGLSRDFGTEVIYRASERDRIRSEQHEELDDPPRWFRIDWIDHNAICQTSPDGESWKTVARQPLDVPEPIAMGIAACGHDTNEPMTARFEQIEFVELLAPTTRVGTSVR